jgi:hypothetical protein
VSSLSLTPYRTLDEVVDGFDQLERDLRQRRDRRSIFLTLYRVVSTEMRQQVAASAFEDPAWVHRYAVGFANLYRQAFEDFEAGRRQRVPRAWLLAFDAGAAGGTLVLQDVFLGVNAHVNHDLAYALFGVSIDPDRPRRYRDHAAVNRVLGSVTDRATTQLASLYAPGLDALDQCAGELDEMLSLFSLEVARESAWESALGLANARGEAERGVVMKLIGARAAVMSRLLLAPSLSPTAMAVCRRLEQGTPLLTLLGAIEAGASAAMKDDRRGSRSAGL